LLSITLKQSQVDLKSYKGLSSHFKQCQITSNDFKNFSTFADVSSQNALIVISALNVSERKANPVEGHAFVTQIFLERESERLLS
jgi:hypothetical protein